LQQALWELLVLQPVRVVELELQEGYSQLEV
jgi:hypothetical protein